MKIIVGMVVRAGPPLFSSTCSSHLSNHANGQRIFQRVCPREEVEPTQTQACSSRDRWTGITYASYALPQTLVITRGSRADGSGATRVCSRAGFVEPAIAVLTRQPPALIRSL